MYDSDEPITPRVCRVLEEHLLDDFPRRYGSGEQLGALLKMMLETIRSSSLREQITSEEYESRLRTAKSIFIRVRESINLESEMTEEQKTKFDDSEYWSHKKIHIGDLIDVWPVDSYLLRHVIREYLDEPYMQFRELNYLITDALLYAEISAFGESDIAGEKVSVVYERNCKPSWPKISEVLVGLLKWGGILIGMVAAYQTSKEVFLLLGISAIAHQSVKALLSRDLKHHPEIVVHDLFTQMLALYNRADPRWFNAGAIWEDCAALRSSGATFDGVMYEMLQRQIAATQK